MDRFWPDHSICRDANERSSREPAFQQEIITADRTERDSRATIIRPAIHRESKRRRGKGMCDISSSGDMNMRIVPAARRLSAAVVVSVIALLPYASSAQ